MDISGIIETSFWKDILYEILTQMDPWDVDLAELATQYADKVEEMKEMNFRIPANVVIVSSVLLRMKADIVNSVDVDMSEFMDSCEDLSIMSEFDLDTFSQVGIIPEVKVEEDVPIQIKPRRVPKRRVSAMELIAAIQEVLEEKTIKKKMKGDNGNGKTLELVLSTNIKELIEETYQRVMRILSKNEFALFSKLVKDKEDMILTFISLLYLSNNQKLILKQKKLYEEIFIKGV